MRRQIEILIRLELMNLFGRNVLRHTRDPKARRKGRLMALAYALVILVMAFYMGAMAYGLSLLGAGAVVPPYLAALSGIFIFLFGTFTAGGTLFRRNGYEMLCALPLRREAIVVSRFVRMYVEDLLLTLVIMVPGLAVHAVLQKPWFGFYPAAVLGTLAVPLIPLAAAAFTGALVTGISSRMKHKGLAEAGLSIALVLGIFALTPSLSGLEEDLTLEMLAALTDRVLEVLNTVYPPAVMVGRAMNAGDVGGCLVFAAESAAAAMLVVALVAQGYHSICGRLFSNSARHDYRMTGMKQTSLLTCLCRREFRRYFASGNYVSNTIIGPILGTVLSGTLCFMGVEQLSGMLMLPVDISGFVPFLVAVTFCMMSTASVSVSMEGKHFWVVKTLPIPTKTILDAKILMNLLLLLPFYLVSEVFLILGLKPGFPELVWLLAIPAVSVVFACVYGVAVNLRLPLLDWESEAAVVKQSASALVGGLGGGLVILVWGMATALIPGGWTHWGKLAGCLLLLGITAILYRGNNRFDLKELS